jgi:hypothetical protein
MKRCIYLFILIISHHTVFSQATPSNGIYLVSDLMPGEPPMKRPAQVTFNPLFFDGDPDNFKPLTIDQAEFVPFILSANPVVQHLDDGNAEVIVQLTDSAMGRLRAFCSKHVKHDVAIIVDDQVIALYRLSGVVAGGVIKITHCTGVACTDISRQLKMSVKP